MNNSSTTFAKKAVHDWAHYDALPRHIKELIWEAPGNSTTAKNLTIWPSAETIRTLKAPLYMRNAALHYGPDHPQAQMTFKPLKEKCT